MFPSIETLFIWPLVLICLHVKRWREELEKRRIVFLTLIPNILQKNIIYIIHMQDRFDHFIRAH